MTVDIQPCADLNNNGVVDGSDLSLMLSSWGPCTGCHYDLNGGRVINAIDLALLLSAWGVVE